jgi:hypothetical protein
MRAARMQLKSPTGWFAAGREIEEALFLVSDSAFRLLVWICLHAERATGALHVEHAQLTRVLRKSTDEIVRDLDELRRVGVCRITGNRIVIEDRFWPYERRVRYEADTGPSSYVAAVRCAFLRNSCVVSAFTAADEKLAREWYRRSVRVETVERAILLGVARKYAASLNHGSQTPITSLEYFAGLISEVENISTVPGYWTYIERKVRSLETDYRLRQQPAITETK